MATYALDTDIVSYMLKGNQDIQAHINDEIEAGNRIVLPPIVYYEIKRWLIFLNADAKVRSFDALCEILDIEDMERSAFETAATEHARIKRAGYNLDDGDILIAAYCIANEYTLATNNLKHFELFEGLSIVNWL